MATWLLASVALVTHLTACSDGGVFDGPVISTLVIQSPLQSDATTFSGSVYVTDQAGLDALTLNVTISTSEGSETIPVAIKSTVLGQTEATVQFELKRKAWIAPGTQQIAVTAVEVDTPSNTLSTNLVVQ